MKLLFKDHIDDEKLEIIECVEGNIYKSKWNSNDSEVIWYLCTKVVKTVYHFDIIKLENIDWICVLTVKYSRKSFNDSYQSIEIFTKEKNPEYYL